MRDKSLGFTSKIQNEYKIPSQSHRGTNVAEREGFGFLVASPILFEQERDYKICSCAKHFGATATSMKRLCAKSRYSDVWTLKGFSQNGPGAVKHFTICRGGAKFESSAS